MSFPSKETRAKCWSCRDEYWNCLDEGKTEAECKKFRDQYEKFCSHIWVKHFDRKREFIKFKEQIEQGGICNNDKDSTGKVGSSAQTATTATTDLQSASTH